jgi:hypothetical protein
MSHRWLNAPPPVEQRLETIKGMLVRVREWRDQGAAHGEVSFSSSEVLALETALRAAVNAPALRSRAEALRRREFEALRIVREQKGPGRFRAACAWMGWLKDPREGRKYPKMHVVWAFHWLTHAEDEVAIHNPYVAFDPEENARFVSGCPKEPSEAIDVLVDFYGVKSRTACIKYLQRALTERQALVASEDPRADEFPPLDNIPYAADEDLAD